MLASTPPSSLSLRAVAREAGVSHTAPYHYFSDRTALLEALGTECMVRFVEEQRDASDAESGPDRIVAQGLAYVRFAHSNPHAFALIFDPAYCDPRDPSPERAVLITANEVLLHDNVRQAQAAGAYSEADTEDIAVALWGTVHGLARLVLEGHMGLDVAESAIRAVGGRPLV